jgi:2-polyprenyl-3-methyl-5-hydroxy-6-metoxy-1,4-benzoquinol methylase
VSRDSLTARSNPISDGEFADATRTAHPADYSDSYDPDTDFDRFYTIATGRKIAERVRPGDRVLELGCATGLMASVIQTHTEPGLWVGLDRSEPFLRRAAERMLPRTSFARADLDDLTAAVTGTGYDHVLATNVLHELRDPLDFLRRCSALLAPDGVIHLSLQNPHSIHRLCALELGLIHSLEEVSERGAQWGTRGLWTAQQLEGLAAEAGLEVQAREGVMLKPLPNSLMAQLPENVIEGFIRAATHLPEVCAITYLALANG